MHMTRVLIADDIKDIRETLERTVTSHCPQATVVAATSSVASTVEAIREHAPDVVLLDVEMKDGTGFDVLKQFPSPAFKVIFITAYMQYSIEAFRFAALDYLLKPVDPDRLAQAIRRAADQADREKLALKIDSFLYNMQQPATSNKKIVLRTNESIHVVSLQNIMYCEADQSYTTFYLQDASRIMVTKPLREYEELFSQHQFIRIHQSYLVNISFIKRYDKGEGGQLVLSNEKALPVSVRKKEQLMQLLARL
ncbi:MAG: hypothetical protein K0S33_3793 [Bacteroidetes bacterium]|jgi:two-component system LytT family response regulator|nr:hypothetical protein [Bacteroidota bacterium]